jgi:hypothetical protein
MVNGRDYTVRLGMGGMEAAVPFLSETLREKVCFSGEHAPVEGDGRCGGLTEKAGTTGGLTAFLTLESAPPLLGAAFGKQAEWLYVSGTRNLYTRELGLCAADDSERFYLCRQRGTEETVYGDCYCGGFELRIERNGAVKPHMDIDGDTVAETYTAEPVIKKAANTERFKERGIEYFIDGEKYNSVYRFVLSCDKSNGCKTEAVIYRYPNMDSGLPGYIGSLTLQANMFRDIYEERRHGKFSITVTGLRLLSDGTEVCSADTVIGGLRYVVTGVSFAEVFSKDNR